MSDTALDFSQVTWENTNDVLVDSPVGGEQTAPGPEIFDTFKDSQGRFRTQSLFIEHPHKSYPAFFTLKKYNKDGYISMYQKYMEIADPTEYQVAIRLLGSWDHWQALKRAKWFREHLAAWRDELRVKMESDRYYEMLGKSDKDTPQAIQATRWLADRYGESKDKTRKAGRPSKQEKEAHLKRLTQESEDTDADAARIGITQ
jgi:hypothetical protein